MVSDKLIFAALFISPLPIPDTTTNGSRLFAHNQIINARVNQPNTIASAVSRLSDLQVPEERRFWQQVLEAVAPTMLQHYTLPPRLVPADGDFDRQHRLFQGYVDQDLAFCRQVIQLLQPFVGHEYFQRNIAALAAFEAQPDNHISVPILDGVDVTAASLVMGDGLRGSLSNFISRLTSVELSCLLPAYNWDEPVRAFIHLNTGGRLSTLAFRDWLRPISSVGARRHIGLEDRPHVSSFDGSHITRLVASPRNGMGILYENAYCAGDVPVRQLLRVADITGAFDVIRHGITQKPRSINKVSLVHFRRHSMNAGMVDSHLFRTATTWLGLPGVPMPEPTTPEVTPVAPQASPPPAAPAPQVAPAAPPAAPTQEVTLYYGYLREEGGTYVRSYFTRPLREGETLGQLFEANITCPASGGVLYPDAPITDAIHERRATTLGRDPVPRWRGSNGDEIQGLPLGVAYAQEELYTNTFDGHGRDADEDPSDHEIDQDEAPLDYDDYGYMQPGLTYLLDTSFLVPAQEAPTEAPAPAPEAVAPVEVAPPADIPRDAVGQEEARVIGFVERFITDRLPGIIAAAVDTAVTNAINTRMGPYRAEPAFNLGIGGPLRGSAAPIQPPYTGRAGDGVAHAPAPAPVPVLPAAEVGRWEPAPAPVAGGNDAGSGVRVPPGADPYGGGFL